MNLLKGMIGIAVAKTAADAIKNGIEKHKEKKRVLDEAVESAEIARQLTAQTHKYRFQKRGLYVFDEDGILKYKTKPDTVNIGKKTIRIYDSQGEEVGHIDSKGIFDSEEVEYTAFEGKEKIGIITNQRTQFKFESYVMWEVRSRVFDSQSLIFDANGNLLIIIETSILAGNGKIYRIKYTRPEDEFRGLLLVTAIDAGNHLNDEE